MVALDNSELLELRKKIDALDKEMLSTLEERFELINDVARFKKKNGMPFRDLAREEEVIKSKYGLTELPEDFVNRLFRLIMDEALKREEEN